MSELVSEPAVINVIADEKSLIIFNSIAKGSVEGRKIQQTLGLSRKQYYSRTECLIKAGLISRRKGRYSLTALGIISYHIELQLESAIKNYWNLKAIDSIQDLHKMDKDERIKIIKRLVTDKMIQSILDPY
jgi:predicted transcriptional regulator